MAGLARGWATWPASTAARTFSARCPPRPSVVVSITPAPHWAAQCSADHLAEPRMKSALARLFTNAEPAIAKLETFLTQTRQAP